MNSTLQELFRFHDWAFSRMLHHARGLTPDQLDAEFPIGPASLRRLLIHLYECELWWLSVARGNPALVGPTDDLPLEQIDSLASALAADRNAFLSALPEPALTSPFPYTQRSGRQLTLRKLDLFLHVLNHAVHHRAQAVNLFRRLGGPVPFLDYLASYAPKSVSPDAPETPPTPHPIDPAITLDLQSHAHRATETLLTALSELPPDSLDAPHPIGPAPGSVLAITRHLLSAELIWTATFDAFPTARDDSLAAANAVTTLPALRSALAATHARLSYILSHPHDPARPLSLSPLPGLTLTFPTAQVLLQLPLHRTHHLAQLANLLRTAGRTPPSLDYLALLPS